MNKSANQWLKRILKIIAVAFLMYIAYIMGSINAFIDRPNYDEFAIASYALKDTGITDSFEPEFVVHGSYLGRDHYNQTMFTVNSISDRESMLELMRQTEGWHVEGFSASDYRGFAEATWYPEFNRLIIADSIKFDAWYYVATSPSHGSEAIPTGFFSSLGMVGRGYVFAVFDVETGLFVCIDQFG